MDERRFLTQAEALGWLVPDAIAHAVEPFLDILPSDELESLRSFLDDVAALHPRIRTAATRAARSLVPETEEAEDSILEAARKDARRVPVAVPPKVLELPYEGAPDLRKPDFHATTLAILKALAKRIGHKREFDDLVSIGWVCAVEIAPSWDHTKSSYESYLWRCARSRMINEVKKYSNSREKAFGSVFHDLVRNVDSQGDNAEGKFRRILDATAMSHVLSTMTLGDAEERASRRQLLGRLVGAFEQLPASHKDLFVSVYFDGTTVDEARALLGLTEGTARNIHAEGLEFLRQAILTKTNVRALRPRASRKKA